MNYILISTKSGKPVMATKSTSKSRALLRKVRKGIRRKYKISVISERRLKMLVKRASKRKRSKSRVKTRRRRRR